jgi:hypothetical protein
VRTGSVVADIGAGNGALIVELARAAGRHPNQPISPCRAPFKHRILVDGAPSLLAYPTYLHHNSPCLRLRRYREHPIS